MTTVHGRDAELARAGALLRPAERDIGVLVLEGEAGIGKTTVWREVVRRAEERGMRALACRPAEAEAKLALSAVADLLDSIPSEALVTLPPLQREAIEAALLRGVPDDGAGAGPRTLATALRSLLLSLSERQPLLVAVDDVQWLDATSATVLGFAMRRLIGSRVGWLLSHRTSTPARLAPEQVVRPESVTRVTVGPLTLGALHHVLEDRLESTLARPALVRIHRASGGNPFYALELMRELGRAGDLSGRPMPVPDDLRKLLERQLGRLPTETQRALLVASALSTATTAHVDEHALAAAEEADVVHIHDDGRIVFRHPLFAAAVHSAAPRIERRAVHADLARRLTDPEERARHLALATDEADETVAQALEEGAQWARTRGAWESAGELFERARALTPAGSVDEGRRRGLAAVEHHVHAGDRPRGRSLLEELLAEPLTPAQRADALRLLAEISWHDENFTEAARLLDEASRLARGTGPSAAIELWQAFTSPYVSTVDFEIGSRHARRALALAEEQGDAGSVARALAFSAMYEYLCGRGVAWESLERALTLEDRKQIGPIQMRPSLIDAFVRMYVGRHDEARERLQALCDKAVAEGDESDLAFVQMWLSWLETRSGRLDTAVRLADEAAVVARLTGSDSGEAWAKLQRAYVGALLGEVEDTRRACTEGIEAAQRFNNMLLGLWIAASNAVLELSLGRPDAAASACEPLLAAVEEQGIGEPVPLFFLPDALEALVALGELDRAAGLLDTFETRARELDRTWALATGRRCRGLLLAARSDLDGAAAAVDEALAEHARLDMPIERARTLLVRGQVLRRRGERRVAGDALEQAITTFDEVGARLWAEQARAELARVPLRRSAGALLTPTEERVAALVAQGMSNGEVARALFVSKKTVEANLTRIYRKLEVRSRAALVAQLVARETSETPAKL